MNNLSLLNKLEFGQRIAEDEANDLEKYFLQTEEWKQVESGKIDVIYGAKGAGKSAIYTLLIKKKEDFKKKNILLAAGENIMGDTIFKSVVTTPPASEVELQFIWKLYCLSLIANVLREEKTSSESANILIDTLVNSGILPPSSLISSIFKSVKNYVKNWVNRDAKSVEHAITIDPNTQIPIVTRKVEFSDIDEQSNLDQIPVDELFTFALKALEETDEKIWLLFDRLDVAFADNQDFEKMH